MEYSTYVFWTICIACGAYLLYKVIQLFTAYAKPKSFPDAKVQHKYAILIPARRESKVIEALLKSIKASDYPEHLLDIYVTVADDNDPTIEICKKYKNTECWIFKEQKTKSMSLNYTLKRIFKEKKYKGYEAFFIFDADNLVAKDFFTEMNKSFDAGYDMAIGYRNSKNWNESWISVCSGLTFTMLNGASNKFRSRAKMNLTFSGTGLYVRSSVLEPFEGWPFQTLTEDYEMSLYAILNNLKTAYVETAEFFDEQPVTFKNSWNQRKRWLKGYAQANKKYRNKIVKSAFKERKNLVSKIEYTVGVIPLIFLLVDMILYGFLLLFACIFSACHGSELWLHYLLLLVLLCVLVYTIYALYGLLLGLSERKRTNISTKSIIKGTFTFPIFMGLFIPLYMVGKSNKEVKWVPIERESSVKAESVKSKKK